MPGQIERRLQARRHRHDDVVLAAFHAMGRAALEGLHPAAAFLAQAHRHTGPGEPAADFRIDGPAVHGVPGLVNLFGIESPGLTSSLAIAELVLQRLDRSKN